MSIEQIRIFLGIAIMVIMLGMGLSLTIADFTRILKNPKPVSAGLIAQLILLPLIAYLLITIFNIEGALAVGVMLIASAPGGAVSNMFTFLARGDIALSVSLTAITCLVTIISIPFIIDFSISHFLTIENSDELVNKGEFFKTLILLVLLPVSIGMAIRKAKPKIADKSERPVKIASIILLAGIIAVAAITNSDKIKEAIQTVGYAIVGLNIITMFIGYQLGKLLQLNGSQRTTIAIECGIQNGTLAIGLASIGMLGNYPNVLLPPALYSVFMFFTGGAFSYWMFKKSKQKP